MVPQRNPNSLKGCRPKLIMERGLSRVLVGTKEVPLPCCTLLLDAEVSAVHCHQTIVANVVFEMALKHDL
jgi:hypothetical protein